MLSKNEAAAGAHFNVVGQQATTLLHDGHGWKDFAHRRAQIAGAQADHVVHASFAFVLEEPPGCPLRSLAQVNSENEEQIFAGPVPACVVRLGYDFHRDVGEQEYQACESTTTLA